MFITTRAGEKCGLSGENACFVGQPQPGNRNFIVYNSIDGKARFDAVVQGDVRGLTILDSPTFSGANLLGLTLIDRGTASGAFPAITTTATVLALGNVDGQGAEIFGVGYGGNGVVLRAYGIGGTRASPQPTANQQIIAAIQARGYANGAIVTGNPALFSIIANSLWTAASHETAFRWQGTPVGSVATAATWMFLDGTGLNVSNKVGIGAAPTTTSDLVINHSVPTAIASACVLVQGALNAPASTDLHPNAFRDTTIYTSTVAADAYASYDSNATLAGSLAYNHFYGYQARQVFTGSNTLGIMAGFTAAMGINAPGGTITEVRGFYVPDLVSVAGTVTHYAGLFIDQLTAGTTRHAIYHNGNDPWFSAGGQIFTSQDLTPPAGATTCRLGCTFDQSTQTGLAVMNRNATATGTLVSFCNSGGTVQGTITQTNSTTVAYNTSSDSRLKDDVQVFEKSGDIIDSIQPVTFKWKWQAKNDDARYHGFIAQELNEVYPEAVTVGAEKIAERPWQVDKTQLIPLLVAEIKSLRARLFAVEATLALN